MSILFSNDKMDEDKEVSKTVCLNIRIFEPHDINFTQSLV